MKRLITCLYHPIAKGVIFVIATLVVVALLSWIVPLIYLNALANLWAFVNVVRVLWYYNWTSDWSSTEIGRGTVAIKASLLLIIVVGLIRRTAEQIAVHTDQPLQRLGHGGGVLGETDLFGSYLATVTWVVIALVLGQRLELIRRLQRDSGYKPSIPKMFDGRSMKEGSARGEDSDE